MEIAILIVRLIVGLGFFAHGAQKILGLFGGYGLAGTGGYFESIGFRPGKLFAAAAGWSEMVAGLLVALGLFGPVGPALLISVMVVALAVHAPNGFFGQNGGFELPLVSSSFALLLAFTGPGPYALDALVPIAWTPASVWLVVAIGVVGGLANLAVRKKLVPAQTPG